MTAAIPPEVQRDRELIRQALEAAGSCAISHVERVQNKLRPLPVEPKTVTVTAEGEAGYTTTLELRLSPEKLKDSSSRFEYRCSGDWVNVKHLRDDLIGGEVLRAMLELESSPPSTDTQEETTREVVINQARYRRTSDNRVEYWDNTKEKWYTALQIDINSADDLKPIGNLAGMMDRGRARASAARCVDEMLHWMNSGREPTRDQELKARHILTTVFGDSTP